jgi:hypothetical protein
MDTDLSGSDRDILRGLNHNLVSAPTPPQAPVQKKIVAEEMVKNEVVKPPIQVKREPIIKTENRVLTQLRQTFGLEKIKRTDVMFNGMVFTLKALTAYWLSWADSAALISVVDDEGKFNRLEYEAALKIYLAAAYIEKVDGLPVTEVFGEREEKPARTKLANFLLNESSDLLGKRLFETYDAEIEPFAKITAGMDEALVTYKCTKCEYVMPYERSTETYYCHKDGAPMEEFKMEADLPLP